MTAVAERIAQAFHEAYERRAPEHGWTTQGASACAWENVPSANRDLMVAVADELLRRHIINPGAAIGGKGWLAREVMPGDTTNGW